MGLIAYRGFARETAVPVRPERLELEIGAALVECFECMGSGVFIGHPEHPELPCVECKATGRVWIGI